MATLSAFSDEMSHDLDTQIKFLQSQEVSAMEIRFIGGKNIVSYPISEVVEFQKILADAGIAISAIGSPIGKISLDESFEQHLDLYKHTLEVANTLQTSNIRIFSYYPGEGQEIDDCLEVVLERMHKKISLLLGSNLRLIHENEAGIYGHSATNCVNMASQLDSAYFALAYDPANFVWGERISENVKVCWPEMAPYVKHVHIKDWTIGNALGDLPGKGQGQIPELIQKLVETEYEGFITMEPHLNKGGQFGGETTPAQFTDAIDAFRSLAEKHQLKLV
jgi:sugar phosphate isomerase/epimerase